MFVGERVNPIYDQIACLQEKKECSYLYNKFLSINGFNRDAASELSENTIAKLS